MTDTAQIAQNTLSQSEPNMLVGIIFLVFVLAFTLFLYSAIWRTFSKAGHSGWKTLIPIYNVIVWLRLIGRPAWYTVALFIPVTSVWLWAVLGFGTARSFGRGIPFALGLTLLPFFFLPVLAFGGSSYIGPMGPSYRRGPQLPPRS